MTENEAIIRCEKLINGLSVSCATIDAFEDENKGYATFETMRKFAETCKKALEEIQQYRAIGTVEEFKSLKEKAEPKEMDRYYCPICRHYFEDTDAYNYCPVCGQKMKSILE